MTHKTFREMTKAELRDEIAAMGGGHLLKENMTKERLIWMARDQRQIDIRDEDVAVAVPDDDRLPYSAVPAPIFTVVEQIEAELTFATKRLADAVERHAEMLKKPEEWTAQHAMESAHVRDLEYHVAALKLARAAMKYSQRTMTEVGLHRAHKRVARLGVERFRYVD